MLVQKAYFAKKMNMAFINTYNEKDLISYIGKELYEFVKDKNSYIQASFSFDENDFKIVSDLKMKKFLELKPIDFCKETL